MKKIRILIGVSIIVFLIVTLVFISNQTISPVVETSAHTEDKIKKVQMLAYEKNLELNKSLVPDPSVSDTIACAVFLRFIGEGYRNPQERNIKKKYLAMLKVTNPNDQENLLQHAESFVSVSKQIELNSKQYRGINRNDNVLRKLGKDKSKLTKDVIHNLKRTLTRDGWVAFKDAVLKRIKPRIKVHRKN